MVENREQGGEYPALTEEELGQILDFIVNFSRELLLAGANLERVELGVEHICEAYGLVDQSLYLLSTHVSISAKTREGLYASRQISVPACGIHLERLRHLSRLSYDVCEKRPPVHELGKALEEAKRTREYPDAVVLLGQMLGMSCLIFIFQGSIRDVAAVWILTAVLH